MPVSELTNTQALIDRYYTEEKEKKAQALTRAELHLQLDANDLAMLSTIAKRFGKSRDDLAKEVLSHALIDLLTQIEPVERKLITRDADEMGLSMAREIAEENGVKDIGHKTSVWTGHDRAISKAEKKRAKDLDNAKKIAAKEAKFNKNSNSINDESHQEAPVHEENNHNVTVSIESANEDYAQEASDDNDEPSDIQNSASS